MILSLLPHPLKKVTPVILSSDGDDDDDFVNSTPFKDFGRSCLKNKKK